MMFDELADAVIAVVRREPTEPSGLGMRRIISGLFRQVVAKDRECLAAALTEAAERQEAFASLAYTQHSDADRQAFRHAAAQLKIQATELPRLKIGD